MNQANVEADLREWPQWLRGYGFIDYATQGYGLAVALLILLFHNDTVPLWPGLVGAHIALGLAIHGLVQWHATRGGGWALDFLRHFYPVLLYTAFYRETGLLNQMFVSGYVDSIFVRLDQSLFGGQPSLELMERWPSLAVSELFYAAYFSYYVMISGVGLALYVRNRGQFFHYISVISFLFYVCYLCYIFLPVMGPRSFSCPEVHLPRDILPPAIPEIPAVVQTGLCYRVMAWIYGRFAPLGAAFPSSHVAVAICTLVFSWRYLVSIRVLHLGAVLLLWVSTVYCRYHYAVDVLGGIVTAAVLIPVGHWLYRKFPGNAGR